MLGEFKFDGKTLVKGVGKDEPTTINEKGGAQSETLYRFDLVDPLAMMEMCKVLKEGSDKYGKYGFENWRNIPIYEHLNHLLIHTYAYLAGDESDEHLSHIMCRAMFAQGVAVQNEDIINFRNKIIGGI